MFLSVIICTYRRVDCLERALFSLERQTYRGIDWEVLIVENDVVGCPAMKAVYERHKARLALLHVVEFRIGLSNARNTGLRVANGNYVAYLDDDAEADSDWVAALVQECRTSLPDFCGGPIYPLYRTPKPDWFLDRYATGYEYGENPRWLCQNEYFGGGNFVANRELCLQLGGFRTDLGMNGNVIAYGEDTEMLIRSWEFNPNLRVRYVPHASIRHEVRPEKMFIYWHVRSAWAGGRSSVHISFLKRNQAVRGFFRGIMDIATLALCPLQLSCNKTEEHFLWQQWVIEMLCPRLWNLSRNWHACFRW